MTKIFKIADSHAHLDMPEFDPDREQVIRNAEAAGVTAILCPLEATDPKSLETGINIKGIHPQILLAAGVHPHQARQFTASSLDTVKDLAQAGKIRAVGEIGLDYYYDFSPRERQIEAFRLQLESAEVIGLPAIIHNRISGHDIIRLVLETRFAQGGVLHCFTEDWNIARQALDLGFYISFSGILTFPKSGDLRQTAAQVPLDRLLVETDAPYLAPIPHRGKRNEPAYLVETAKVLAGLKNIPVEELAAAVTRNYEILFEKNERQ